MKAILASGGKQYVVSEGQRLIVERVEGDSVTLPALATFSDGSAPKPGGTVKAKVAATKGSKLVVFKMKAKKRYRVKRGHRQQLSELTVTSISS
jgi:large subunit ribosomal protein L21